MSSLADSPQPDQNDAPSRPRSSRLMGPPWPLSAAAIERKKSKNLALLAFLKNVRHEMHSDESDLDQVREEIKRTELGKKCEELKSFIKESRGIIDKAQAEQEKLSGEIASGQTNDDQTSLFDEESDDDAMALGAILQEKRAEARQTPYPFVVRPYIPPPTDDARDRRESLRTTILDALDESLAGELTHKMLRKELPKDVTTEELDQLLDSMIKANVLALKSGLYSRVKHAPPAPEKVTSQTYKTATATATTATKPAKAPKGPAKGGKKAATTTTATKPGKAAKEAPAKASAKAAPGKAPKASAKAPAKASSKAPKGKASKLQQRAAGPASGPESMAFAFGATSDEHNKVVAEMDVRLKACAAILASPEQELSAQELAQALGGELLMIGQLVEDMRAEGILYPASEVQSVERYGLTSSTAGSSKNIREVVEEKMRLEAVPVKVWSEGLTALAQALSRHRHSSVSIELLHLATGAMSPVFRAMVRLLELADVVTCAGGRVEMGPFVVESAGGNKATAATTTATIEAFARTYVLGLVRDRSTPPTASALATDLGVPGGLVLAVLEQLRTRAQVARGGDQRWVVAGEGLQTGKAGLVGEKEGA